MHPGAVGPPYLTDIPDKCRITMEIEPGTALEEDGVYLRSGEKANISHRLNFNSNAARVELGNTSIAAVSGLNKAIKVDIILYGDIFDVCIDKRRYIVPIV
jgi:hypothetical protein